MTLQQARPYVCFTIDSKFIFALDKNGGYFLYVSSRFKQTYGGGCFRKNVRTSWEKLAWSCLKKIYSVFVAFVKSRDPAELSVRT